jgi:histidyl-tRNA synthetase
VRGLDYYSKIVFEFVSNNLGAQNAFCAGGRYDQLIKEVGGKEDQPAIGAAFGIERLMLMLEPLQSALALPQKAKLYALMPLAQAQQPIALLLADQLSAYGFTTEVFLQGDSIKSMLRQANKLGAAYCLIIGEEEQQMNQVTIKNMMTGGSERVAQSEVIAYLTK